MIRTLDAKYIESYEGQQELYLTNDDPKEEHNAAAENPALAQTLASSLHTWQAGLTPAVQAAKRTQLDPGLVQQLRALGYVK